MTEKTQPTDAEISACILAARVKCVHPDAATTIDIARAVLAKWGTPAPAEVEPVQWQKRHQLRTGGEWENTKEHDAKWWRDNSQGWEIRALYTTQQPTQAQAGAVPTRAFLERTLAAMEGVIDVADRKTDEFDALRSCVIDLTLMLFSDAKRHTKGACHER